MVMQKYYLELEIAFNETTYDLIYNRLYINGITSILEENGTLKVCMQPGDRTLAEKIINELADLDNVTSNSISLHELPVQNWNKEWEKTIKPVYIKDKLVIYPSWKRDELDLAGRRIAIEIDPKMSFGTGHNETTQLILEQMAEFIDPNIDKYLLDFGSGTGILSIAAVKLGISKAIAIEIDDDSIENSKEYFRINKVESKIKLYQSDLKYMNETGFDVIAANIIMSVIVPNLKLMRRKLKPNGKLFITGILKDETEEMLTELTKHNFIMKNLKQKAEWSAFYAVKK
jgi:ribosomal protein L11 methyltransferase